MYTKQIVIFILSNIFFLSSFGQKYDFVKVLPGKGIVFNNDSILLFKTTVKDVCKILKIKDPTKPNEYTISMWDGYSTVTGKDTSGTEYTQEIKFKSLLFQFDDDKDRKNLKLKWITTKEDFSLKIYTDNGLEIGMINPKIEKIYSVLEKCDYVSENKLTYNLYTYGVSFQLEKTAKNELKLVEISTHHTLKR